MLQGEKKNQYVIQTRGVLVTHDYDKSKIIKDKNDIKHNFEKSKSNFMKIFGNLSLFRTDY